MSAREPPHVSGFRIKGYGLTTYCKITKHPAYQPNAYLYDIAFGTGRNKWCMNAKYDTAKKDTIYIDRVENNNLCTESNSIPKALEASSRLVNLGLHVMHLHFPDVILFTLMDDSHIYCKGGQRGPSIFLAYETILKYNQTWYQQKCGAVLPGFVSMRYSTTAVEDAPEYMVDIPMEMSRKPMIIRVIRESIMDHYVRSFAILDEPCRPMETYDVNGLLAYRELYEASSSPRDFITTLRTSLGKEYCHTVHTWFNHYIRALGVKRFEDSWMIPIEIVQTPPDFSMTQMPEQAARAKLNGGGRNHQTRKSGRWHLGPREIIGPGGFDGRSWEPE